MKTITVVGVACIPRMPGGPHSVLQGRRAKADTRGNWAVVPGAVLTASLDLGKNEGRRKKWYTEAGEKPSRQRRLAARLMTRV